MSEPIKVSVKKCNAGWRIEWVNPVWGPFKIVVGQGEKEKPSFEVVKYLIKQEQTAHADRILRANRRYVA